MPIKRQSIAAAKQKREVAKAYAEIAQTRPMCCEACGSRNYEHSHNYPQEGFKWLAANPENITLLTRTYHLLFEAGRVYMLPNGQRIMEAMYGLYDQEQDQERKEQLRQHLTGKFYQIEDRAREDDFALPDWHHYLFDIIKVKGHP